MNKATHIALIIALILALPSFADASWKENEEHVWEEDKIYAVLQDSENPNIQISNRQSPTETTYSFDANLSGAEIRGRIAIILYSESGQMKSVQFKNADLKLNFTLKDTRSSDRADVVWLDNNQKVLAVYKSIGLTSQETASMNFAAACANMIRNSVSGFGADSLEEGEYSSKRLIVGSDKPLPNLSEYYVQTMASDGHGCTVIQFLYAKAAKECAEYLKTVDGVRYVEADGALNSEPDIPSSSGGATLSDADEDHTSWGVISTHIKNYRDNLLERKINNPVVVAVIDQGIELDHPRFNGRLTDGYDFIDNDRYPSPASKYEVHGTHVAGIVADCTKGMNIKIMPLRAIPCNSVMPVKQAIDYAVQNGAKVINLSLGGELSKNISYTCVSEAIQTAVSEGVIVVATAGNNRRDVKTHFPGNMSECFTVSAVNKQGIFCENFSNYGDSVNIAAPGEKIDSSSTLKSYEEISGTSQAAPHVSAACALLLSERGVSQSPEQIMKAIQDAALKTDLTPVNGDNNLKLYYGAGILDMGAFVHSNSTYTISYRANGGNGTMSDQSGSENSEIYLNKNAFYWNGYRFTEWNTRSDGSGISYEDGAEINLKENLILYAQWEIIRNYRVTFHPNGGRGDEFSVITDKVTFPVNHGFTIPGNEVVEWNTRADGTGSAYRDGQTLTLNENITLYAQWKYVNTIVYDSNGGSGNMETQIRPSGSEAVINSNEFFRSGYYFTKWNTRLDGTGVDYFEQEIITIREDLILYAQWESDEDSLFYALLYDDGDFIFQNSNESRRWDQPVAVYPIVSGSLNSDSAGWYDQRENIRRVIFDDPIMPYTTAQWFYGCTNLTEIENIYNLNTTFVTNMDGMFANCVNLYYLDISNFDTSNVSSARRMFYGCESLVTIVASYNFNINEVSDSRDMFTGCESLEGEMGTAYSPYRR